MIVPMKKVHVVALQRDMGSVLESLRDLGVVHVEHQEPLTGYQLQERREEVRVLEQALQILKQRQGKEAARPQKPCPDWTERVNTLLRLLGQIEHLQESLSKREGLIRQWEPWGDFSPQDIAFLRERGIYVNLYESSPKEALPVREGLVCQTVGQVQGRVLWVAMALEEMDLPYREVKPPLMSLGEMRAKQKEEADQICSLEEEIQKEQCYRQALEKTLAERRSILEFEEVERGMRTEGPLVVLKGFCPEESVSALEKRAKEERWGLLVEDPQEGDQVPTLLRNPSWVRLSAPVLKVIEILPGYWEFDISRVLLIFFVLFFAILIGDAAYGLIFMGMAFWAHRRFGKAVGDPTPFHLAYILTAATCVWGVLTGTYFGQKWLPSFVHPVIPWLNDFTHIQLLCFIIALTHLSIARVWAAVAKWPSVTFLSEAGWLSIIWGMFFVANMFVLGMPFPPWAAVFFWMGIPLAFFFMVEPKDFLKTVGMEIVPFFLSVIGAGTDLVSYIRLFAVGLATVAVADATNSMAATVPVWVAPVVLLIGHGLNLILALMAILVHAIRLNVLEFSGQLGLEWKGIGYKPFKKWYKA